MPFYEYECSSCKFYTEILQKIGQAQLKECPSCKRKTLKKLISAPVFRLKGGGWYETDFKSDKENKRNLVQDGSKEEPKSTETKEETKPAAKGDKADAEPQKSKRTVKSKVSSAKPARRAAAAKKTKRKKR